MGRELTPLRSRLSLLIARRSQSATAPRYPDRQMPDIERRPGLAKRIASASWRDLIVVGLPTVLVAAAAVAVAVKAARFAPPKTIYFVSGPDGSGYRNQAEKYQKIL